jgi:5-methylcytosine-specific restriction endonuclease McrA
MLSDLLVQQRRRRPVPLLCRRALASSWVQARPCYTGLVPYADPERQRQFQREWVARNRRSWLAEHGPCCECGSRKNLQVDHVNPAKKVDHKVWSWSPARRKKELAKCQVLCGDCHKKKTAAYRRRHFRHGMYSMYKSGGCRCDKCRAASAKRMREWRRSQSFTNPELRQLELDLSLSPAAMKLGLSQ